MSELRTIARHAGTVLVGQLATMAFGITDTIVAGRHSDAALAALSVGSAIYISVYVALMGIVQALLPLWSQQRGAGQFVALGRSVRQALYVCAFSAAVGMAVLLSPGALMRWTGVPAALQGDVSAYLGILALALPPALLFRLFTSLNQSLGRPTLVTTLQLASLVVKVPLTLWLALGGGGLAAQGAAGCAWATLAINYLLLAIALGLLRGSAIYVPYRLWQRPERPDWAQIRTFARLGIPAGLGVMVEVTSFTLMALFIARQGVTASASHQIAANVAAVLYMVPLSIGIAASARVGYWLGAGEHARARTTIYQGFWLVAVTAAGLSAILFVARETLAGWYSGNVQVVSVAAGLLAWVALYHLVDGIQALSIFLLRCFRVTVLPMAIYAVLLWGAGLGGGFVLAYRGWGDQPPLQSPAAFWSASAAALAMTALAFVLLLRRTMRRHLGAPARAGTSAG